MINEEILAKIAELQAMAQECKNLREIADAYLQKYKEADKKTVAAWLRYEEARAEFPNVWESEVWK